MESILTSVKKQCGLDADYKHFDVDIIMYINSVFMILKRVGVGPINGFRIKDEYSVWTDFLPDDDPNHEGVKTYVGAKVRLMFDPPTNSVLLQNLKDLISELEWTLNINVE